MLFQMATEKECVDNAPECVRLSELTTDEELREWLLVIARQWMSNAVRPERIVRAGDPVPPKRAA